MDEAINVHDFARALGATERKVSIPQMRMAIATWYLNVERKATKGTDLARHAVSDTHNKIFSQNPVGKCVRGQCDLATFVLFGVFICIWVIIPLISVLFGMNSETGTYPCLRPMLSASVVLTGFGVIGQGIGMMWVSVAFEWCSKNKLCRFAPGICTGMVTFFLVITWAIGMWQVTNSTPAMCGLVIWQIGNLLWVVIPFFVLSFCCCCLPCIYLFEFCQQRDADKHVMEIHAGSMDSDIDF